MACSVTGCDRQGGGKGLVDERVGSASLFAHHLNGSLEDVAFSLSHPSMLVRGPDPPGREMENTNKLQGKANRLTAASLAVAQGQAAPLLVVKAGDRELTDARVIGYLRVDNNGGGPAEGVVVATSWGDARLEVPVLQPGGTARARVEISVQDWRQHGKDDPEPMRLRDRDAHGEAHDEPVRRAPDPPSREPMVAWG